MQVMKKQLNVVTATLLLLGATALEGTGFDGQWLGVLWTKGQVLVGGAHVSSGTTVLPGDVITTAQGASAWLRFRSPASTILLTDTQVSLLGTNSTPSLVLHRGTVVVDEKAVDPLNVTVPGGFVLVKGDPQSGAECEVAVAGGISTVSVRRGLAEVHSPGGPMTLHAGELARIDGGLQGSKQVAGRVSKEIDQSIIQREGQTQENILRLNDQINWNDLVRTLATGRVQIKLLDGSTVNLASRSTIKILKHNPQTQKTELDFTVGKAVVDVHKITLPDGIFTLYTKQAIVGRINNAYVVWTDDKHTKVCDIRGVTEVRSSDPNNTKVVKLRRYECTDVLFLEIPTDPVFSPNEMAGYIQETAIGGTGKPEEISIIAGGGGVGGVVAGIVLSSPPPTSPTTP